MKQNDVLKAIAIPSFKMLTAQDLENVRVTIQNVLEDSDSLNDAQILSEDIITGLKNMKELLNIYVEQLVTSAEKELTDLAEKLGE
jgi:hypothetical protein